MPLLSRPTLIPRQDLSNDPGKPIQLRSRRRPAPPVPGRHRKRQHLGHRPRVNPKTPRRLPLAHHFNLNRKTNPSVRLHALHPPAPVPFRQRPSAAGFLLRRLHAILIWLRWAKNPCNLTSRPFEIGDSGVAGERPKNLWVAEPARECVSSPAVPSNPNSRLGRGRSSFMQGRDRMEGMVVGIDVSKDRLDVAVRPTGEGLVFKRTAAGILDLVAWLKTLSPVLVAIEATGGFETVVAAGLASACLPVVVVNPAQVRAFAMALGKRAKTDPIDAAVIAHFAEATKPQLRQLPDA